MTVVSSLFMSSTSSPQIIQTVFMWGKSRGKKTEDHPNIVYRILQKYLQFFLIRVKISFVLLEHFIEQNPLSSNMVDLFLASELHWRTLGVFPSVFYSVHILKYRFRRAWWKQYKYESLNVLYVPFRWKHNSRSFDSGD